VQKTRSEKGKVEELRQRKTQLSARGGRGIDGGERIWTGEGLGLLRDEANQDKRRGEGRRRSEKEKKDVRMKKKKGGKCQRKSVSMFEKRGPIRGRGRGKGKKGRGKCDRGGGEQPHRFNRKVVKGRLDGGKEHTPGAKGTRGEGKNWGLDRGREGGRRTLCRWWENPSTKKKNVFAYSSGEGRKKGKRKKRERETEKDTWDLDIGVGPGKHIAKKKGKDTNSP